MTKADKPKKLKPVNKNQPAPGAIRKPVKLPPAPVQNRSQRKLNWRFIILLAIWIAAFIIAIIFVFRE